VLHLFDTAQGKVVPFEPREPGKVSMYVCGPTVYGPPHLGHGRFSLVFDVLRRYLTWTGLEVNYVSNITDIDDKIIKRANDEGRDWSDIAQKCEQVWWKAMEAIGVERPTSDPHATAYVDQMVELIADLIARDVAYVSDDGVYFTPTAVADYGLLARQSIESLQAGARVEVADHKHSPIDFALWKFTKPGEPAWPSPWGEGRPGWHTECVVMSLDLLGDGFDLHGGGQDLAFPHHETNALKRWPLAEPLRGTGCITVLLKSVARKCRRVSATSPISLILLNPPIRARIACLFFDRTTARLSKSLTQPPTMRLPRCDASMRSLVALPTRAWIAHPMPHRLKRSGKRWTTISIHRERWRCCLVS